jgi:hypothetical protein
MRSMQIKETQYVVVFGIFSQYSTPWYFRPPCRQKDSEEKTTVRAELFSRFHSPVDRSQFGAGADSLADYAPKNWTLKTKDFLLVFLSVPLPCVSPHSTGFFSHDSTPKIGPVRAFSHDSTGKLFWRATLSPLKRPDRANERQGSGMLRKKQCFAPRLLRRLELIPVWLGTGIVRNTCKDGEPVLLYGS